MTSELISKHSIFKMKSFCADNDKDIEEYETIMNDDRVRVLKENTNFDKHGAYHIALHWVEACTEEEYNAYKAKKKADAKAPASS